MAVVLVVVFVFSGVLEPEPEVVVVVDWARTTTQRVPLWGGGDCGLHPDGAPTIYRSLFLSDPGLNWFL